jgi:hypothetical protein
MKATLLASLLILVVASSGYCLGSNNQLSDEMLLTKNGESYPLWFEKKISTGYKRLIVDDLNIILRYVTDIDMKLSYSGPSTSEKHKRRRLEYKGEVNFPSKYLLKRGYDNELFGKVISKDGKLYVLISKELIDRYSDIYKNNDQYEDIREEVNTFIELFNNLENVNLDDVPDIRDIAWDGSDGNYDESKYSKEYMKKARKKFVDWIRPYKLLSPPLIAIIKYRENDEARRRGIENLQVEMNALEDGELVSNRWIPLIKHKGKFKLGIGLLE